MTIPTPQSLIEIMFFFQKGTFVFFLPFTQQYLILQNMDAFLYSSAVHAVAIPIGVVVEYNRCLVSSKYFYGPMEFSLNSFSPFPSEALLYIVCTNTNLDSFL